MALAVELQIVRQGGVGDLADGWKPVDGSGGSFNGGVCFNSCRPVGDSRGVDGAVPEAVFVSSVGVGGAVVAVLVGFAEAGGAVIRGEEDEGILCDT